MKNSQTISRFLCLCWALAIGTSFGSTHLSDSCCTKAERPKLSELAWKQSEIDTSNPIQPQRPDTWEDLVAKSTGIWGKVVSVDTGGYATDRNKVVGEACLEIQVIETFWGPEQEKFSVWFEGVDVPGRIRYDQSLRLAQLDSIEIGTEVFLACWLKDCCWCSSPYNLFLIGGDTPMSLSEEDLELIRARGEKVKLSNQLEHSDLVCRVDFVSSINGIWGEFEVSKVIKGESSLVGKKIALKFPYHFNHFKRLKIDPKKMWVFIRHQSPEDKVVTDNNFLEMKKRSAIGNDQLELPRYEFLEWFKSIVFQTSEGPINLHGLPVVLPPEMSNNLE